MTGALAGICVVDLTRVLAGPTCTQILGDLGAEVIKIERPVTGDETRFWGPPFLQDTAGNDTTESAYYLCANRNKKSVTLDIGNEGDLGRLFALLETADILVENFKPGSLEKHGLAYGQLKARFPKLVYCSITGYGHTGPYAAEPGYDFIAQGLCGLMSVTGAKDGEPAKAGVAVVDYTTGLYAATGILAALHARNVSGEGQHIDLALLDCGLAMMSNIASYALVSGREPARVGNAHTTIVPYNAFRASDGWIILAVGNDMQFRRFATFAGHPEWADDPRFAKNTARVTHRAVLTPLMEAAIALHPRQYWLDGMTEHDVPCGPVNTMGEALAHPQTAARDMVVEMEHAATGAPVRLVGSPLKMSGTPVTYREAPPTLGQHDAPIKETLP